MDMYGVNGLVKIILILAFLVITAVFGLIVWIVKSYKNRERVNKRCKYCAEILKLEETVCHHCGRKTP